jgi:lysophospholipase L1-like esterase
MYKKVTIKPDQTIVFIGDSITDAGRTELAYKPLGNGYVNFAANTLLAKFPNYRLNIINTGVSGDTVRLLAKRWDQDCIQHNPDVVSVMIGINDLWRQHVEQERLHEAVFPQEYEITYRLLLSNLKRACNCEIILAEPFMFCNDPENKMYKGLQTYLDIVHKLAEEFDATLVTFNNDIEKALRDVPSKLWSDDMVHPFVWAHCWIAQRWLDVIDTK